MEPEPTCTSTYRVGSSITVDNVLLVGSSMVESQEACACGCDETADCELWSLTNTNFCMLWQRQPGFDISCLAGGNTVGIKTSLGVVPPTCA